MISLYIVHQVHYMSYLDISLFTRESIYLGIQCIMIYNLMT
jgi:hypothetical protein